jgi:hypothetical protein
MKPPLLRALCAAALMVIASTPARGQLVVNDPVNTLQNIAIVAQAIRIYEESRRLRDVWEQFRQEIPLGRRAAWVIDETRWRTHGVDPADDPFGTYAPLATALDLGDPQGAAYLGSVIPLEQYPSQVVARLPTSQRDRIARDYANILMADGFGRVAVQTSSDGRWHSRRALEALAALQSDLLNPSAEYNGNIGMLQKTTGARLISARTTGVGNHLLASLLEAALTRAKIARDADARRINADIYRRLYLPTASREMTAQTDRVLRDFWRH